MVRRHVERGEVVEVVLDLGTVGDFEAERAEQRLDPLDRARDRMQAAGAAAAAGQRDVDRVAGKLPGELRVGECVATLGERFLDERLDMVDARAGRRALGSAQFCERFHVLGNLARLAEVFRLRVLERRGIARRFEGRGRFRDDAIEFGHGCESGGRKKREAVRASLGISRWIRPERLWPAPRSS